MSAGGATTARRIARAHGVVRDPLLQHATANIRKYLFVTYTKYLFIIVTDVTSFSIFVRAPKNCRARHLFRGRTSGAKVAPANSDGGKVAFSGAKVAFVGRRRPRLETVHRSHSLDVTRKLSPEAPGAPIVAIQLVIDERTNADVARSTYRTGVNPARSASMALSRRALLRRLGAARARSVCRARPADTARSCLATHYPWSAHQPLHS